MLYPRKSALALALAVCMAGAAPPSNAVDGLHMMSPTPIALDALDALRARPELLLLRAGAFDPLHEQIDFAGQRLPTIAHSRYGIVQFDPAQAANVRDALSSEGAEIVGFLPNNAYQVRWARGAQARLAQRSGVRWTGAYQPGFKLAPELLDGRVLAAHAPSGSVELEVHGFRGERADLIAGALAAIAPEIEIGAQADALGLASVRVNVPAALLETVLRSAALLDAVVWVEPYLQPQLANRDSVGPIQNNSPSCAGAGPGCATLDEAYAPLWRQGLLGTGQIVAVSDSGLDRNEEWFTALDLGAGVNQIVTNADDPAPVPPAIGATYPDRKVYGYWVQPGATAYDAGSVRCSATSPPIGFHGTHVVGSVLGDAAPFSTPTQANYTAGDGMAPNAQVLMQDIGNDTSGCLSIADFGATLVQAYAGGAGIHSGSWGNTSGGAYGGNDQRADAATWVAENLLVNMAAGNSGPNPNTVGSPGNGKNINTIGGTGHGFASTMYGSSSRGPTDDGRRKPDILAPAMSIVSAAGDTNNGATVEPPVTSSKTGTSMATPTASGGAALLRQYFMEGFYPLGRRTEGEALEPTGALMKAALINGAAPFTANWPDNNAGWGRMWLANSVYFEGGERRHRHWMRSNEAGLETGDVEEFTLQVHAGQELRATLAWYDVEGALGSGVTLVNDLDLELVAPDATQYLGNVYASGQSTTGGSRDDRNTVEQVRLTAPAAGTYTLRVRATSVPGNGRAGSHRQGYALVVGASMGVLDRLFAHNFDNDSRIAAPTGLTASANDINGITITANPVGGADSYQLYRATGTCATVDTDQFRYVGQGNSPVIADARTQGGYSYAYRMRGIAEGVEGPISGECVDVVSAGACSLVPQFDDSTAQRQMQNASCSVALSWDAGTSNCPAAPLSYRVWRDTSPLFASPLLVDTVTGTSHTDSTVLSGQPYYYRIDAIDAEGNVKAGTRILNATPIGVGTGATGVYVDDIDDNTYMDMQTPWSISNLLPGQGNFSYRSAVGATYTSLTCADLKTLPVTLAAGSPQLQYLARWQIEADWDGVVVELSSDGGANWTPITPTGGYPGNFSQTGNPPINVCGYPASQGAFNGTSAGFATGAYQSVSHDLSAWAGQQVLIRWRLSSDPGSEEAGFFIDNVRINADVPAACTP
jgi:hypothetical protein